MPYSTKYTIPFKDITGNSLAVNFLFKDYSGSITTLIGGGSPCIISSQNEVTDTIRGFEGTFQYINTGAVPAESFITEEDEGIRVEVYDITADEYKFIGFVAIEDSSEAYMPSPTVVTIRATDNLGLLKDVALKETTFYEGRMFIIQYLQAALAKTGLSLPINVYVNVFENGTLDRDTAGAVSDPYGFIKIDPRTFLKDESTYDDCFTVIDKLISAWNCQLFQYNGEWHIVRWCELSSFNNLIPGTRHTADLTSYTAVVLPAPLAVGRTEDILCVNASQLKTTIRPIKYDKLTFNYEQPKKLILNDDFHHLGTLITTYDIPADDSLKPDWFDLRDGRPYKVKEYEMPDWLDSAYSPHPDYFIRVITNEFQIEKDRYAVLRGATGDTSRSVASTAFEINEFDRISYSFSFKTSNSQSGIINLVFAISITDGTTTLYLKTDGTWQSTLGITFTINSGENTDTWNTVSIDSKAIPFDGMMTVFLAQESTTNEDTFYKDLSFTYYTFINQSTEVIGQYHKSTQTPTFKKNIERTIYTDDSPKNNIKGTMFLLDGVTKTSVWHTGGGDITADLEFFNDGTTSFINVIAQPDLYNYFNEGQILTITSTASNNNTFTIIQKSLVISNNFTMTVTPDVVNETVSGVAIASRRNLPFGYIQKVDLMKINYAYRTRLEGDFKGYGSLISVYTIEGLTGKYFITGQVKYDLKTKIWAGVLQEIWSNEDVLPALTNTFDYIYKTQ